jgi:hypothetical protein
MDPVRNLRAENIIELFAKPFFFGCEADDPGNASAFDAKRNTFGVRLGAIFSSDIGHWGVPDMREVCEEAWELVEHGVISEQDFRDSFSSIQSSCGPVPIRNSSPAPWWKKPSKNCWVSNRGSIGLNTGASQLRDGSVPRFRP